MYRSRRNAAGIERDDTSLREGAWPGQLLAAAVNKSVTAEAKLLLYISNMVKVL